MSDGVVLASIRRRMGPVDDSALGRVEYVARESAPVGISISGSGLPPVEIDYAILHAPCRLGSTEVTLDAGARAVRRKSFSTKAMFGGRPYALVPRWYRSAWFVRDGERLALFTRRRGRTRAARWVGAASTEELALAHALAAYGGIGAPGAVFNILTSLA